MVTLRLHALSCLCSNTAVQFTTHLLHTTTYTVPSFLFPRTYKLEKTYRQKKKYFCIEKYVTLAIRCFYMKNAGKIVKH